MGSPVFPPSLLCIGIFFSHSSCFCGVSRFFHPCLVILLVFVGSPEIVGESGVEEMIVHYICEIFVYGALLCSICKVVAFHLQ